jgi:hypothetical protein
MTIIPLFPVIPPAAVWTKTEPLEAEELEPELIITLPPVEAPDAVELAPPERKRSPPAPLFPEPTPTKTSPALPFVAIPEPKYIPPLVVPAPVVTITRPTVRDETPALNTKSPPEPLFPDPTATNMEPARPAVESPEDR